MSRLLEYKHVFVKYRHNHAGIYSIKDLLTTFSRPFQYKTILNDISFTLEKGESLGILGRNGSGKSTLLRTMAGIVKPYKGSIECDGSIAPILALGVGLEMELTGYENIDLLLALYGQGRDPKRIADIIAFSELDDVTLKQAVKCYSSGMLARLSFSISFANDCDIYIIDEVLAVGDFGFQSKCMQKINELKAMGKSIIFVSHFPDEWNGYATKPSYWKTGKNYSAGKGQ
ncbi:O-antigen export system ATP-binding protein RfbB [Filimonas sp.]|nr:O-antigen export system ATP-binding protein RfbB [Filimonas sp.]